MTFAIDTGASTEPDVRLGDFPEYQSLSERAAPAPFSGIITAEFAREFTNSTISEVWSVGDATDLDRLTSERDLLLEALFLAYPDLWDEIDEALDECRASLSAANPSAQADTDPAAPGNSLGITF